MDTVAALVVAIAALNPVPSSNVASQPSVATISAPVTVAVATTTSTHANR